MGLFDQLARHESDALWWVLMDAQAELDDECARLAKCPPATRDDLYGPGTYDAIRDTAAELAELVSLVADARPSRWTNVEMRLGGREPGLYLFGRRVL